MRFRCLSAAVLLLWPLWPAAAEPFLRENDVVSYVGGEDLVAAAECAVPEAWTAFSFPSLHLKFRSLAWEGDTVFEQRRDLNYPNLEEQLQRTGTTVIFAEFGSLECLGGAERLPAFMAAYEALLDRLSGGGTRRILLITPPPREQVPGVPLDQAETNRSLHTYGEAVASLGQRRHWPVASLDRHFQALPFAVSWTRDGVHLNLQGQEELGRTIVETLAATDPTNLRAALEVPESSPVLSLLKQKNQLWYYYSRPQNWAFLAGDRTNQPSSRDHLDPTKRWFPAEMERFLPLIEAKEREIQQVMATTHNFR